MTDNEIEWINPLNIFDDFISISTKERKKLSFSSSMSLFLKSFNYVKIGFNKKEKKVFIKPIKNDREFKLHKLRKNTNNLGVGSEAPVLKLMEVFDLNEGESNKYKAKWNEEKQCIEADLKEKL